MRTFLTEILKLPCTSFFLLLTNTEFCSVENKKIVITGGPGTGKSSVIKYLESLGYQCLHEVSREVTLEAQQQGIAQLFLENPLLFSQKLLEARVKQFESLKNSEKEFTFIDRGIPDVVAYLDYFGTNYPETFPDACKVNNYDKVFLLPPWKEIYKNDNERYETFKEAESIYSFLIETYLSFGYNIVEVPKLSVENRCNFIIGNSGQTRPNDTSRPTRYVPMVQKENNSAISRHHDRGTGNKTLDEGLNNLDA